jgi:hypothetical protein
LCAGNLRYGRSVPNQGASSHARTLAEVAGDTIEVSRGPPDSHANNRQTIGNSNPRGTLMKPTFRVARVTDLGTVLVLMRELFLEDRLPDQRAFASARARSALTDLVNDPSLGRLSCAHFRLQSRISWAGRLHRRTVYSANPPGARLGHPSDPTCRNSCEVSQHSRHSPGSRPKKCGRAGLLQKSGIRGS